MSRKNNGDSSDSLEHYSVEQEKLLSTQQNLLDYVHKQIKKSHKYLQEVVPPSRSRSRERSHTGGNSEQYVQQQQKQKRSYVRPSVELAPFPSDGNTKHGQVRFSSSTGDRSPPATALGTALHITSVQHGGRPTLGGEVPEASGGIACSGHKMVDCTICGKSHNVPATSSTTSLGAIGGRSQGISDATVPFSPGRYPKHTPSTKDPLARDILRRLSNIETAVANQKNCSTHSHTEHHRNTKRHDELFGSDSQRNDLRRQADRANMRAEAALIGGRGHSRSTHSNTDQYPGGSTTNTTTAAAGAVAPHTATAATSYHAPDHLSASQQISDTTVVAPTSDLRTPPDQPLAIQTQPTTVSPSTIVSVGGASSYRHSTTTTGQITQRGESELLSTVNNIIGSLQHQEARIERRQERRRLKDTEKLRKQQQDAEDEVRRRKQQQERLDALSAPRPVYSSASGDESSSSPAPHHHHNKASPKSHRRHHQSHHSHHHQRSPEGIARRVSDLEKRIQEVESHPARTSPSPQQQRDVSPSPPPSRGANDTTTATASSATTHAAIATHDAQVNTAITGVQNEVKSLRELTQLYGRGAATTTTTYTSLHTAVSRSPDRLGPGGDSSGTAAPGTEERRAAPRAERNYTSPSCRDIGKSAPQVSSVPGEDMEEPANKENPSHRGIGNSPPPVSSATGEYPDETANTDSLGATKNSSRRGTGKSPSKVSSATGEDLDEITNRNPSHSRSDIGKLPPPVSDVTCEDLDETTTSRDPLNATKKPPSGEGGEENQSDELLVTRVEGAVREVCSEVLREEVKLAVTSAIQQHEISRASPARQESLQGEQRPLTPPRGPVPHHLVPEPTLSTSASTPGEHSEQKTVEQLLREEVSIMKETVEMQDAALRRAQTNKALIEEQVLLQQEQLVQIKAQQQQQEQTTSSLVVGVSSPPPTPAPAPPVPVSQPVAVVHNSNNNDNDKNLTDTIQVMLQRQQDENVRAMKAQEASIASLLAQATAHNTPPPLQHQQHTPDLVQPLSPTVVPRKVAPKPTPSPDIGAQQQQQHNNGRQNAMKPPLRPKSAHPAPKKKGEWNTSVRLLPLPFPTNKPSSTPGNSKPNSRRSSIGSPRGAGGGSYAAQFNRQTNHKFSRSGSIASASNPHNLSGVSSVIELPATDINRPTCSSFEKAHVIYQQRYLGPDRAGQHPHHHHRHCQDEVCEVLEDTAVTRRSSSPQAVPPR